MLRVIIADDEERICQLICALADWERLDMEVAGVAHNGVDALDLVRQETPDILITDIRMPGMAGLEVIRRAKEDIPWLEVIIISGYAQFDYAQTAIQYGVGEYLLKPINKEALNSTLGRLAQNCRSRQQAQENMQRLESTSNDGRKRLRESLPAALLAGSFAIGGDADMARQYGYASRHDTWQCFLLKTDCDLEAFSAHSLGIVQEKARDILMPLLGDCTGDCVMGAKDTVLLGIIDSAESARSEVRRALREGLNLLVAQKNLFGEIAFSLALGQGVASPAALPESLENVQLLLGDRLLEGTGRLLEGETAPSGFPADRLLASYAREIARAVDVLDADEAQRAVHNLALATAAHPGVRGFELIRLAQDAGGMFIAQLGVEDRQQEQASFRASLDQANHTEALFECLRLLHVRLLTAEQARRKDQDERPIRMAKQYIQSHFAEPITLEEVAAAIGFSPNYFSTLFKKEVGEGFAKYLTHVRMEQARSLLRETRLSVAEVCRQAGFGDIKHFNRTFRAETGLTPGEYRKLYG